MACEATAAGWANYGFETYYALLNSGFELAPSAGTANGVHPVPLGYSRVYVHVGEAFSYKRWFANLERGRSFATNGPMLFLRVGDLLPGDRMHFPAGQGETLDIEVEAITAGSLDRVELIINGEIVHIARPTTRPARLVTRMQFTVPMKTTGTSWLAARCFETMPANNVRFAHTGPIYFDDPSKPIQPRPEQIQFLYDRVQSQIELLEGQLPEAVIAEYRQARDVYRSIMGEVQSPQR
jgi:hypothetical protein